jgi:hypothetical protein
MDQFNEVNINSEGLIYINTNLKIHALKVHLFRQLTDYGRRLQSFCSQCTTDDCLNKTELRLTQFIASKSKLNE